MGAAWLKCACCHSDAIASSPPRKKAALQELLVTVDENFSRMLPTVESKIDRDILLFSPELPHKASMERDMSALVPRLYFSRSEIDGFCDLQSAIAPPLYRYYTRRIAAVECNNEIMSVLLANSTGYVGGLLEVVSGSFTVENSLDIGWSTTVCKNVSKRFGLGDTANLGERFLFAFKKEALSYNPADQIIKALKFLGLSPSVALKDLTQAFQKLIRRYHPNKSPSADFELYIRLLESYFLVWYYIYHE